MSLSALREVGSPLKSMQTPTRRMTAERLQPQTHTNSPFSAPQGTVVSAPLLPLTLSAAEKQRLQQHKQYAERVLAIDDSGRTSTVFPTKQDPEKLLMIVRLVLQLNGERWAAVTFVGGREQIPSEYYDLVHCLHALHNRWAPLVHFYRLIRVRVFYRIVGVVVCICFTILSAK